MKKATLKSILFLLLINFLLSAFEGEYKIESVFPGYDGDKKTYLLTLFLPYNPTIVSYSTNPKVRSMCQYWWPKGHFHEHMEYSGDCCDLLWVEGQGNELEILSHSPYNLKQVSAIFTTTTFRSGTGNDYGYLKSFLEASGFAFFGHWYHEGQEGEAMFIRKELLAAALRTLNYSQSQSAEPYLSVESNLQRHFKKADCKSQGHQMDAIDFIYMINLDERPEKYTQAVQELANYDIHPYRFSAVNGWNLSTEAINQVGVKFLSNFDQERFLGSVYREIDGCEYLGHEILRPNGETYFTLGMSRGAIGICLSHLSILQDAYDSGYETIWIMEDDVEAVSDPREISDLVWKLNSLIKDWDILFTDIDTKDRSGQHVACRAMAARPNVAIEPFSLYLQRFYAISLDFSRIGMRYGAYSMIVKRSGMEKILNYFKSNGIFLPYDMDIWLNPDLKMYSVTKDIVSHRSGSPTDNSEPNYSKR